MAPHHQPHDVLNTVKDIERWPDRRGGTTVRSWAAVNARRTVIHRPAAVRNPELPHGAEVITKVRNSHCLWKVGRVRQAGGGLSLGSAVLVAGLAWVDRVTLGWRDTMLAVLLVAVLLADGTVNILPAGFTTFEDRVQAQRSDRGLRTA